MTESVDLPQRGEKQPVILLVEDEVIIRMVASEYLQDSSFTVLEASTALEAIKMLQGIDTKVDLVFSDIRMPGELDGFGLARWVRQHRPEVALLLTSGDANLAEGARHLSGQVDLIRKPYDLNLVVDKIRALVVYC